MKRILAVLISLSLIFCLVGCKGTDKKKTEHSIDVEYYAKLGQIPEYEYKLGSDAEAMRTAFDAEDQKNAEGDDDGHLHSVYSLMEMDDYSFLSYKNANYYYKNDNDSVFAVVGLDTAYGFSVGTVILEVKEALSKFKPKETDGKYDKIFFMPISDTYTSLEYEFGKNTVIFVFEENLLCATMICESAYFVE